MATEIRVQPVTEAALVALSDDARVEVVEGRLIEQEQAMTPAGAQHGAVSANIAGALWAYARASNAGKVFTGQTTYVLDGTPDDIRTMRIPDVSFIAAGNLPDKIPPGFWYRAPDLAIEVVSPGETAAGLHGKIADYFTAGTREVWAVYPLSQQIVIHKQESSVTLGLSDALTSEELLPGFVLKLADVFE